MSEKDYPKTILLNDTQEIEKGRTKLGNLLGLGKPVSGRTLLSVVKDSTYAHNLFICRSTPEFLNHLVNNPPCKKPDSEAEMELKDKSILDEANKLLEEWQKTIFYQEQKETYERRYGTYIEALKKSNPSEVPCKPCAEIKVEDFREVYLDHNATTYIRPEVSSLLAEYYSGEYGYGNPSSNTVQGSFTADLVLEARKKIAACLKVMPEEIFFTGSGSEANNLAIKGIAFKHLAEKGHLITTKVEHASVLKTMEYLESLGFSVTYLDVDESGAVSPESVKKAIRDNTILVSTIGANNEIGTINPLEEIGKVCKAKNVPFMVDGIQAFGKITMDPKDMGISILTFSGHKIYAPKGIGGIYVEKGLTLVPQVHGGGQEDGLRSGTENVGSIMAFGKAAELAHAEMEDEQKRLLELREIFLKGLEKIEPGFIINGPLENRLSNNLNIGFAGVEGGALLRSLNKLGISISLGSACNSRKIKASHVLAAIGSDTEKYAAIRFSFGLRTGKEDIAYLLKYLVRILQILREKK